MRQPAWSPDICPAPVGAPRHTPIPVRPEEERDAGTARLEAKLLEATVHILSRQAKTANVIIEEALEAGLDGSHPVAIDAKMLRIELIQMKAGLEAELARLDPHCSTCGRSLHWDAGVGVGRGRWAHIDPVRQTHEPVL